MTDVSFSEEAKLAWARLPNPVRNRLDKVLEDIASAARPVGTTETGTIDGVGPDGSRFTMDFVGLMIETGLHVDILVVLSY